MKRTFIQQTLFPTLFWVIITATLFTTIKTFFNVYDEGFAVFNATRLLNHEVPYRDFWALYPPGQLYILASLYKTFGISLATSRVYDTLVRLGLVVGVFLIVRKMSLEAGSKDTHTTEEATPVGRDTRHPFAYAAALGVALVLASQGFYSYAVYPALAISLYAIYSTLKFAESNQKRWLVIAGVISGVACIIRWDIGLYVVIGLSGALFFHQVLRLQSKKSSLFQTLYLSIGMAGLPLAITLVIMVIAYGLVSLNSGFNYVWDQLFYFPATQMRAVRWLAYPELLRPHINQLSDFWTLYSRPMDWLRFYLPLALYAGIAVAYLVRYGNLTFWIKKLTASLWFSTADFQPIQSFDIPAFGILASMFCGGLLFSQALSRYDFIHVMPSLVAAGLAIAGLLPRLLDNLSHWTKKVGLILLLLSVTSVYFLAPLNAVLENLDNYPLDSCRTKIARASCVTTSENMDKAVQFIQAFTSENEPIYVGNQRHDKIFVNFPGFYFMAARPSATRYSELHPGVANTLPVQQEIANELESKQVRYLVLINVWESTEPNESAKSTGVYYLDNYIHDHYAMAFEIGEYQIWRRRK